jgi:hypothetical protein
MLAGDILSPSVGFASRYLLWPAVAVVVTGFTAWEIGGLRCSTCKQRFHIAATEVVSQEDLASWLASRSVFRERVV